MKGWLAHFCLHLDLILPHCTDTGTLKNTFTPRTKMRLEQLHLGSLANMATHMKVKLDIATHLKLLALCHFTVTTIGLNIFIQQMLMKLAPLLLELRENMAILMKE